MNSLFLNLTHWHWFGFAALLTITELLLGSSFFLLWVATAAVTVAFLIMIVPIAWEYQFLIFSVEAITCILFWHLHLKNTKVETDKPNLNRRNEQYVGRVFTLDTPITDGCGKIKVDDSSWRVNGPDLPAGAKIKVIGVNGVILQVDKI